MEYNFDNERPIYLQLVTELKLAIISGIYTPGSRLPSVRDLAISAKVNPNTVQKAMTELEDTKLIYTERTNGKYVTKDTKLINKLKNNMAKDVIKKYLTDMDKLGIDYQKSITYLQEYGGNR